MERERWEITNQSGCNCFCVLVSYPLSFLCPVGSNSSGGNESSPNTFGRLRSISRRGEGGSVECRVE